VICIGSTSTSFVKGAEIGRKLIKKVEEISGGIPGTSISDSLLHGLAAFGARKVSVVTPYVEDLNMKEREFLEGNGLEVTNVTGMQLLSSDDICWLKPEQITEFALKHFNTCRRCVSAQLHRTPHRPSNGGTRTKNRETRYQQQYRRSVAHAQDCRSQGPRARLRSAPFGVLSLRCVSHDEVQREKAENLRFGGIFDTERVDYKSVLRMARTYEGAGFEYSGVFDHFLPIYSTDGASVLECWTLLGALARDTTSVKLGPLVSCSFYRSPLVMGKMASTLSDVSRGRHGLRS